MDTGAWWACKESDTTEQLTFKEAQEMVNNKTKKSTYRPSCLSEALPVKQFDGEAIGYTRILNTA